MCLAFGSYFSNLTFFRLLLTVPSKAILVYLVPSTYTLMLHLMHKILLFILTYPEVPALSPSLTFCSKAQTLLITYPKSMSPH